MGVFNPLCISPNLDRVAKSPRSVSRVPSPRGRRRRTPATFCDAVNLGGEEARIHARSRFIFGFVRMRRQLERTRVGCESPSPRLARVRVGLISQQSEQRMPSLEWQTISSLPADGWRAFLEGLRQRNPDMAQNLQKHEPLLDTLDAARDENGNWIARARLPDGERLLVPSDRLKERCKAQSSALRAAVQKGAKLVVISGLGIGHLCHDVEQFLGGTTGFLIVEDDPVRVLVASTLYDLSSLVQSRNVLWAVGEDVQERMLRLCRENCVFLLPFDRIEYVLGAMPLEAGEAQHYSALVAYLPKLLEPELSAFDRSVEGFISTSSKPPESPGLVWGYHHPRAFIHLPLLQSLLRGFEAHGWRTQCDLAGDDFASSLRLASSVVHAVPDLYLFLNGPSRAYLMDVGLSGSAEREIARPRISWIVDDLSLSGAPELQQGYTIRDHVFCIDRTYLDSFAGCGARTVSHLPGAPSVAGRGTCQPKWAAPVSFVGNVHDMTPYLERFSGTAKEWVRTIARHKQQSRMTPFPQLIAAESPSESVRGEVQDAAEEFHSTTAKAIGDRDQVLAYFLYVVSNYFYRRNVVLGLLPLGLRVFGPESWLTILPPDYRDRYGGFVSPEDAADAYVSADLSLSLHSFQCPTCLNPRDYDIIMAGGCLLADWVEDFDRGFFVPNSEVALFRSEEEAVETARDLLDDPDRREAMKSAARERLLREHTMQHRVERILEALNSPDSSTSSDN